MKNSVVFAAILMIGLGVAVGEDAPASYGDGVTIEEAVPIETLLGDPDSYLGEKVRVDGVITGVCKKRGCWMQVTDPDTGTGVRIKVEDGVIVFPYTSMGNKASAEGVFEAIKLSPEQVAARKAAIEEQHAGEHAGHDEHAGCAAPVVEDTIYLIRGTGAVIHS